MTNRWLRNLFVMLLAALTASGCASGGSRTEPAEPAAEPVAADPAPELATPAQLPAFDADGNPYVPGTQQSLARTFYFDYDRAVISAEDLAVLEMHASYLRENPQRSVVVEGHCDERGTREYNLALGERRSDAVRSFLTSAGVSPRQIESVSYGEERPPIVGHNEAAWAKSRRAEMIYH